MSPRTAFQGLRCAISGLLLAGIAIGFEALANPVLFNHTVESITAPQADDPQSDTFSRAEENADGADRPPPPPAPEIEDFRIDDGLTERTVGSGEASMTRLGVLPGLAERYGNVFGQGDGSLNQTLRNYAIPNANPAGAPDLGWDRARRAGVRGNVSGGQDRANPAQAMLWEAVDDALRLIRDAVFDDKGIVSFSIAGIEFTLTPGGGRRMLFLNADDLWPSILYGPLNEDARPATSAAAPMAIQESGSGYGGASAAAGQSSPLPHESGSPERIRRVVARILEFLADPITIFAAIGCLIIWLSFVIADSVRNRGR